jgi:hypothetical protein
MGTQAGKTKEQTGDRTMTMTSNQAAEIIVLLSGIKAVLVPISFGIWGIIGLMIAMLRSRS